MLPRLDKLQAKCQKLGLEVTQSGKRPAKSDYAEALRAHFLPKGGLLYDELEPMLCFAEWNLKDEERTKIWTSPAWIAQRKLNGCRAIVHFVAGEGVFVHSRTISVQTYRFQELTDQFTFRDFVPDFTATLDCEVLIDQPVDTRNYTTKGELTKTSLHSTTAILHLEAEAARRLQVDQQAFLMMHTFDIMRYEGQELGAVPLSRRLKVLSEFFEKHVWDSAFEPYFHEVPWVKEGKKDFFKEVVDNGGEGVILKSLNSAYVASSSRRRDAWVKVKKRIEFDAYVTGFQRGDEDTDWKNLVGALLFSVKTEDGEHLIAKCTNLTLKTRRKITIYDPETDEVSLHPGVYDRVAEVSGQDVSSRSLRLSHATIERWRPKVGPDTKTAEACQVKMEDLVDAAEWVGT